MSIQFEQPIANSMIKMDERAKSTSRQMKFLDRLDGDTIYGLGILMIIWGGFIATFWLM